MTKKARYWGQVGLLWFGVVIVSAIAMIIVLAIIPPDPVTGQHGAETWWVAGIVAVVLVCLFTWVLVRVTVNTNEAPYLNIEEQIRIARPVSEVFAFMADVRNDPRWSPQIIEATVTSAGPLRVGSSYRQVLQLGARRVTVDYVVTAYDPPRQMAAEGQLGWQRVGGSFMLATEGTGTVVTLASQMQISPLSVPFHSLIARFAKRQTLDLLERLRRELEQGN